MGALAEQYGSPDAASGFTPVAREVTQQQLAAHTSQTVKRINQERTQNAVAEMTETMREAYKNGAGFLSAEEAHAVVSGQIDEWIGTGGTQEEAEALFTQALTGLAFTVGDEDVVDIAKTPLPGSDTAIFDRPGMAQELEFVRYRASQAAMNSGNAALRRRDQAIKERGTAALDIAYQEFGTSLNTDDISVDQFVNTLSAQGFTPQEIEYAIREKGRSSFETTGNAGNITSARVERLLNIEAMASTEGWTPEVEREVIAATVRGDLTPTQARAMQAKATKLKEESDDNVGFDITKASGLNRLANAGAALIRDQVKAELGQDIRYNPDLGEWEEELKSIINSTLYSTEGSETERIAAAKAAAQAWSNNQVRAEILKTMERQRQREERKAGRGSGGNNRRREGR